VRRISEILTEKAWMSEVVAVAKSQGWQVYHALPTPNQRGRWATHQIGHVGFPDLVLTHPTRGTIFAELKTDTGRLTVGQRKWLETLADSGQETHVWRPRDRRHMQVRLMRRRPNP
jgi:hypothetical protein